MKFGLVVLKFEKIICNSQLQVLFTYNTPLTLILHGPELGVSKYTQIENGIFRLMLCVMSRALC